jgi:glyoxylase-like metal-dependent hydrolase (beta-lactamase superfamily II)
VRTISADELLALLDASAEICVLDVREPDEFAAWSIPGATNVPMSQLTRRREELPRDRTLVSVCAVGARAAQAAGLLEPDGLDVVVLDGGMDSWSRVYDDVELSAGGATIVQVRRRGKGCLSYLVGAGRSAVVIDPSTDVHEYVRRAADRGWTISHVMDTHLHADHLSGARDLAQRVGAELLLSPLDGFGFPHGDLVDDMTVEIGAGVELSVSVLSTPGHTRGSTTFTLGDAAVFTGDVLFLESVGRPDLADQAESFAHALFASLHERILTLPDGALVLPAHAGAKVEVRSGRPVTATLGTLRESLWQLSCGEDEFVAWATSSVSERPPNYVMIVEANRAGASVDAGTRSDLEAGPNRCAVAS